MNGNCVEVAPLSGHSIGVRDSKDHRRNAPVLTLASSDWQTFLRLVKAGQFDI
jgi:hypothetical protein